jgi:hypothetical protein
VPHLPIDGELMEDIPPSFGPHVVFLPQLPGKEKHV